MGANKTFFPLRASQECPDMTLPRCMHNMKCCDDNMSSIGSFISFTAAILIIFIIWEVLASK